MMGWRQRSGGGGDADADGHRGAGALLEQDDTSANVVADHVGEGESLALVTVGHEHDEFLAAVAYSRRAVRHNASEALPDRDEAGVARCVSVGVVKSLDVIDIGEEHGHARVA